MEDGSKSSAYVTMPPVDNELEEKITIIENGDLKKKKKKLDIIVCSMFDNGTTNYCL